MKFEELVDLPGHIDLGNIITLRKYLNKGLVADIGTCAGKSAICMADAGARVLTVDPTPNPEAKNLMKGFDIKQFIETSEEFGKHCPKLDGCFIDGVHSYMGVKIDMEIVKKVKKGGHVLFHDCNLYSNTIRVAVEEEKDKLYKFIEEVGGNDGINGEPKEGSIWVGERI